MLWIKINKEIECLSTNFHEFSLKKLIETCLRLEKNFIFLSNKKIQINKKKFSFEEGIFSNKPLGIRVQEEGEIF